ncbi:MAG: hypothetical protein IJ566_01535 [Cardiobacteriaceae bacterium]|nr:hypothetical protein [Cardiobacteriaceae bacterium]
MKKTVSLLLAAGLMFGTTAGNNPAGNAYARDEAAAAILIATAAAGLIYLNLSDGYYYDEYYNRMPYGWTPPRHYRVQRIEDMRRWRRLHPAPPPPRHHAPPPPPRHFSPHPQLPRHNAPHPPRGFAPHHTPPVNHGRLGHTMPSPRPSMGNGAQRFQQQHRNPPPPPPHHH